METFHRSLGTTFLQGVDNPQFEDAPVVEGPNPEKVNQREEFFDLVLAVGKLSGLSTPDVMHDLT